jgi:hypothetical protein
MVRFSVGIKKRDRLLSIPHPMQPYVYSITRFAMAGTGENLFSSTLNAFFIEIFAVVANIFRVQSEQRQKSRYVSATTFCIFENLF